MKEKERDMWIRAMIKQYNIPPVNYNAGTVIPSFISSIVRRLKDVGVYAEGTYVRDIWKRMRIIKVRTIQERRR